MAQVPIDERELQRLREVERDNTALNQRFGTLQAQLADRDQAILRLNNDQAGLRSEITRVNAQVGERDQRILQMQAEQSRTVQQFQNQLAELVSKNKELQDKIDNINKAIPRMKINQLVEGFRSQVAEINKAVLTRQVPDQPPVLVEQMEVEVKGGLDVSEGLQFAQLRPDQLGPGSVSSVRFTLRPASIVKLVDD
jgi:seryl-tRNA synthetase